MVAPVYDHVTALVFACTLFVSAVVAVPAITYANLLYVDQQQLRNIALEALNSMLLGIGYPSNWGSDFDSLTKFGLALDDSSSFYVLDPEKVERLSSLNPVGYLNYSDVHDLLELQGYGFNIRIMPLFNVTVDDMSQDGDLLFNVKVTFNDGRPIPNAHVEATILYVKNQSGYFTRETENSTNWLGQCTIKKDLHPSPTGYIVVLKTTVADMATITIPYIEGFNQNVANASIIGDIVTLSIPETLKNPPERRIYNVASVSEDGVRNIYDGLSKPVEEIHITHGEGFSYWIHTFTGLSYENPLFLIFNIWTQRDPPGGPKELILFVASPLLNIASGVLQLEGQPSAQSVSNAAIKLSRSVEIVGMTFIFELLLWKET